MGSLCIIPIHIDNVIDISILIDKVYGVLMFVLDKPQPKLKPKPETKVNESPTEDMIINWLQRVRKETEVNEVLVQMKKKIHVTKMITKCQRKRNWKNTRKALTNKCGTHVSNVITRSQRKNNGNNTRKVLMDKFGTHVTNVITKRQIKNN